MGDYTEFIVGSAIICGLLGLLIGGSKGQGAAGLILGALLGFIGLIIVAVMRPAEGHELARPAASSLPPPPPTSPPGWWPDPYARYELRYFDGATWTAHVSNGGTSSIDPR